MKRDLTPFEQNLKQSMANYEAPYDVKSWYAIEKHMNYSVASHSPWIVALAATILVSTAVGLGIYQYRYNSSQALAANLTSRFTQPDSENIKNNLVKEDTPAEISEIIPNGITAMINNAPIVQSPVQTGNYSNNNTSDSSPLPDKTTPPAKTETSNQLSFVSDTRQACVGAEVEFKVTNGPNSGSYLWNFGDGRFSSEANPKHKFAKPGKYDISLSITSDDGQIRTTVSNEMILILPAPDANFEWRFINEDPRLATVQIVNTSNHANQYAWKFDDESASNQASPVMSISKAGHHTVALHVSNDYGCVDDVVKQISVNTAYNIGASSGFRPEKETYMPVGLKNKQVKFELSIYNMQNEKVYETSAYQKGWDGRLPNGTTAAAGENYIWKVIITNSASKEQKYFNGEFTVFP